MVENLMEARGLSRRFDLPGGLLARPRSMMAVRDVSLAVPRGQVVGVVGESGCGKSTLARLLLRLIEPTQGQILFDGMDVTTLPKRELRRIRQAMTMVFQDPYSSLDPRFTVADTLAEPFQIQGLDLPKDRIGEILAQVGLAPALASAYPHHMSGGQRQRIGIARALALHPKLLVLDEPTASLDVSIQAQIISLLEKLQDELGLTYLFISHDLGLVRYFCDRIVVMYLGSVVEELPEPSAAARHPYTRALMDSTFAPDPGRRRQVAPLTSEIPSAFNLPKGCAFAGRCNRVQPRCQQENPPLTSSADGHRLACFNPFQD